MTEGTSPTEGELADLARGVAAAYRLGTDARIDGPAERGQLGQVWPLTTSTGRYAVKVPFTPPQPEDVAEDAAYQDTLLAAVVSLPAVVRTPEGQVLAAVGDTVVRVYEWVDIAPRDRWLDPAAVGRAVAAIHAVDVPCDGPVDAWFTEPVGGAAWHRLAERATSAGAPFAADLERLVPEFTALEELLRPPVRARRCHRDLWADNLRGTPSGGLVVLDWENAGPADPAQELPMLMLEFGVGDPGRMRELYAAYLTSGGTSRITGAADCTMLIATLGHIVEEGVRRWLRATTAEDREHNAAWVAEGVGDPVTREVVAMITTVAAEVNA